jgi:hypothetical protein
MKLIDSLDSRIDERISKGYNVNIENYLRRGFNIFRKQADLFLLFTALYLLSMPVGGFIISAPLSAGFFLAAHRLEKGERLIFDNFFDGFKFFLPLFILTIVTAVIVFIGYLAFIIPGIYLTVAYTFSIFFVVFGKMEFWDAMETSRKLVHREWLNILLLVLVLAFLNFAGALAFGVGLLFTIPISFCALYAAFDDIVGVNV